MKYAPPIGQEAQGEAAHYIDGNPELGILGSPVPAAALEPVQRELVHVIREAGLEPSAEDLTQLWQTICKIIGIKASLATLLKAGLMQPDGKTVTVDEEGLLSALGGNLLLNSGVWITESGEWEAPVTGWYEVLIIGGGDGGTASAGTQGYYLAYGGRSGGYTHCMMYLTVGTVIPVTIGVGGIGRLISSSSGLSAGGVTTFEELTSVDGPRLPPSESSNETASSYLQVSSWGGGFGAGRGAHLDGLPSGFFHHPKTDASFYGGGGGAYSHKNGNCTAGNGMQGAVYAHWHDPAKAAGPLPTPALLSARRMASRAATKPVTVNLYDPETGQGSVWREEDVPAKLVDGMIAEEAWQEICAARAADERAVWLTSPDTEAERYDLLRAARDAKLAATDYLTAADYPLADEARAEVTAYRQALRDLPAEEDAPWDGGGEATPWPEMPTVSKVQEAANAPAES